RTGPLLRSIVGSAVIGFLLFVVLVAVAPDSIAYSPNNYGWNGIHQVASTFPIQFVSTPSDIAVVNRSTLLIMQPATPFSQSAAAALDQFVMSGGTLVIADSSGVSNSLLSYMNLGVSIKGGIMINDPIYNWKSSSLPTALVLPSSVQQYPAVLSGVIGIALDTPSPLEISTGSHASVVAFSSTLSFETNRIRAILGLSPENN